MDFINGNFISMTVGELVKQVLKKRGLSQNELSLRSNVSAAQISRIVNNERGASLDTLLSIADALGIRREEMMRAAAGITAPLTEDEWVEEQNRKLNLIPSANRQIFEKFLESLIEEPKSAPVGKKAKGKV